jgi:hypothetical protein
MEDLEGERLATFAGPKKRVNTLVHRPFMNLNNKNIATCLLWAVFFIAFLMGPVRQLQGLSLMPGDFGDARLNNYFLENKQFILF